MTPEERKEKIESYGAAHHLLLAALERFPREMWQFRATPDGWTIHEIIVHIADSEVNSYVRCRRLIAEPGSDVLGYDENRWARVLRYHEQLPEDALELFRSLRGLSYRLIETLPEAVWANTIHHSENGPMTMDDWLTVYERHIPDHIAQMQTVYDAWTRANPQHP
ncbi:MAG: DinB family protein [Chloroflexota bacterium]